MARQYIVYNGHIHSCLMWMSLPANDIYMISQLHGDNTKLQILLKLEV